MTQGPLERRGKVEMVGNVHLVKKSFLMFLHNFNWTLAEPMP